MGRDASKNGPGGDREQRLKQALKANLQRRKAQARVRSSEAAGDAAAAEAQGRPEHEQESGRDG